MITNPHTGATTKDPGASPPGIPTPFPPLVQVTQGYCPPLPASSISLCMKTSTATPGPPWPAPGPVALSTFYGTAPSPVDATASAANLERWESANLVSLTPPFPMVLAWQPDQPLRIIRCHRLVAPSLSRVLAAIRRLYPTDTGLRAAGLHLFGGCYAHRFIRGSRTALSVHAYGAAIDLDPDRNALGSSPDSAAMPSPVVTLFEHEGWTWGGRFSRPDPMHFEAIARRLP